MAGVGSKPGERRGGRPPGAPNKITAAVKDMILAALAGVGGVAYLEEQAKKNPAAFMSLIGRVLPLQVNGAFSGDVRLVVETGIDREGPANG